MPFKNCICINRKLCFRSLLLKMKFLLLVLCVSMTGCQSSGDAQPDIRLNWEMEPSPARVGKATINITLRDSTNSLITGAEVELEGNMSHPGMNPVITTAEELEPGKYSVDFEFTMGGDWYFIITSTLDDDKVVERQIEIPGVHSQEP